jgi:hypothetical protein
MNVKRIVTYATTEFPALVQRKRSFTGSCLHNRKAGLQSLPAKLRIGGCTENAFKFKIQIISLS